MIQALLDQAATQQQLYQQPPTPPPLMVTTAYSKLPDIMTEQIKPMFNGTITSFFTFLFQLRECCSICHFWAPATHFLDTNLLLNFTTIDFKKTLTQLSAHWTPTFHAQIYEPGSLACASQLLYQVLTTSIKVTICHEVSQHILLSLIWMVMALPFGYVSRGLYSPIVKFSIQASKLRFDSCP